MSSDPREAAREWLTTYGQSRWCSDPGCVSCEKDLASLATLIESREREAVEATGWRCFHCGETFTGEAARAHFGPAEDAGPTECQQRTSDKHMLDAMWIEFERFGLHRNYHNAASVRLLVEKVKQEAIAAIRPEIERRAKVEALR